MRRSPASARPRRHLFCAATSSSIIIIISLALAGCASSTPVAYKGLSSAGQLQPVKDDDAPFQYRSPTADPRSFSKILIDPVSIYIGEDAQFGSVSQEDRKIIADYMQQKFAERLRSNYRIVERPEAGTMRLHLTLTGIETSTPVISTLSHITPIGLAVNTGLQASNRNGTFFGSVSYAAELSDASTGNLLYAYVTRQTPDALNATASFGYLDSREKESALALGIYWTTSPRALRSPQRRMRWRGREKSGSVGASSTMRPRRLTPRG